MAMIGKKPSYPDPLNPVALNPNIAMPQMAAPTAPDIALPAQHQGINWLGVLADALSGAAGQPGMYAQRTERQRAEQTALERGDQVYRTHRADDNADWMSRQQWELQNKPDPTIAALTSYMGLTPEQKVAYKEMHPGLDPDVAMSLGGDRFYSGPRSGLGLALSGGQPAPAAGSPLPPKHRLVPIGGPGSPAPATFRR